MAAPATHTLRIDPGGHELLVPAGENLLAVALAAGLPLPHSCRQGRCASCKARLIEGEIAYPGDQLPPGITAAEAARGEVLLCQARARSDVVVEARRAMAPRNAAASAELEELEPLALDAVRLRLRVLDGVLSVRPGQFVDAGNAARLTARLPVIAARGAEIELEAARDGSEFRDWLDSPGAVGTLLELSGPFDAPR